ncbi:MAG: integration host factor subunit beta [Candidatus Tectomicrobia bacterium]|nr:integration host factor subunit beta [Candidatus Tectomicrobia bacterium]
MTKSDLIDKITQRARLTRKQSRTAINTFCWSIMEALKEGERVELRRFGSFKVKEQPARKRRNPKTGQPVQVASKKVPLFRPARVMREILAKKAKAQ